jgi:hypothetical protein
LLQGKGRILHYACHNTQGFAPDQAALLKIMRLTKAEGDKLLLSLDPIAHPLGLISHTLESKTFIILQPVPI